MLRRSVINRVLAFTSIAVIPVVLVAGPLTGTASATRPPAPSAPSTSTWPASPSNNPTPSFTWTAPDTTYGYLCSLDNTRVACAANPAGSVSWGYQVPANAPLQDGLHTFAVRTRAPGHRPITTAYSWRQDTVPPAAPNIVQPPVSTRATSVAVSFSNSDPSDVVRNTCSLDGAAPSDCESPFQALHLLDGPHHLTVAAFDNVQNSAASTVSWTVDPNAPDFPVVVGPNSPTNVNSGSVSFSTVNQATYTCALDNAAASTCSSATPSEFSGLADGTHVFTVHATDTGGNTWTNSASWVVDTTPPNQPHLESGPNPTTTSPTIYFADDFDLTGVQHTCRVTDVTDPSAPVVVFDTAACSSPFDFNLDPNTADGRALVAHIVPTDGAGNVGPALDVSWTFDSSLTPAPIVWLQAPSSPSNVTNPTFAFNAPDAGQPGGATGFACSLDAVAVGCGSPDSNGDGSYTVGTPLDNGQHVFSVSTTSGTATSVAMTWTWTVDATPPPAPTVTAPPAGTPNPTITFTDSDPTVTFMCSIDGAPFVPCSSPWTPPAGLSNGTHTLVVEAVDAAGNTSVSGQIPFTVQNAATSPGGSTDTTPPTVHSIAVPATLTAPATVTFSEPVTGLTTGGVRMAVTGSSTSLAARVVCLSSGTAVNCSTGHFTVVRLTPAAALVPGQHYTVFVAAGATRDLAGNASAATTKAFRALRTIEENNATVRASWSRVSTSSALGGSYVREHYRGASAAWRFTGTSVTWWTVTGRDQGRATVYVDGVKKASVDNYASSRHYKVARTIKGLKSAKHTLTIQVNGTKGSTSGTGTFVAVDGFTVGKTVTKTPALRTLLRRVASSHYLAGHASIADLHGDAVQMTFRGTGISWYTQKGASMGKAQIWIDGVLKTTVDNWAATTSYGVKRAIGHLTDKVHTVRIVILGKHRTGAKGSNVVIDRLVVS